MYTPASSSDHSVYWSLLRNISSEEKLRLISKLSESLASVIEKPTIDRKEATAKFLDKFCGAWKGPHTAEEIITAIRSERSDRDPISFE